jgi:hypothetical protein
MPSFIVFALLFLSMGFVGCTPDIKNTSTHSLSEIQWSRKAITLDKKAADGAWITRNILPLNKQLYIQQHAVDAPDVEVAFEAVYKSTTSNSIELLRRVKAACPGEQPRVVQMFDNNIAHVKWQQILNCQNNTWRLTLVENTSNTEKL